MTTNRVATTTVQYQVNQSSVAQVQQANQAVAASFASVQAAQAAFSADVLALNPQLAAAIDTSVVAPMQAASAATQNLIRDIGDLGRDIQAIPEPPMSAFGLSEDTGGGGSLTGSRRGLGALARLVGSQAGGGAISDAARFISLSAAFGGLGIAAGVLGLALHAVATGQEEATKTAQSYAAALGSIGTQTSADIQKNLDNLNAQKTAYTEGRGILKEYQTKLDALNKEYGNSLIGFNGIIKPLNDLNEEIYAATGGVYGLKDGMGNVIVNAGMLNSALDENQKSLDKTNAAIASDTTALNSQAVAANNAAAAAKQFSDDQVKAAQATIAINNMTAEQRDVKAKQDMADYDILQQRIEAGGLSVEAAQALRDQEEALLYDYRQLTEASNTYADSLKAVADRTQAVTNYFDAVTAEGGAMQKVVSAQQDLAAGAQDHADKLAQIQQDEQAKETADRQKAAQTAEDDQAKHLQKLADIDNQYAADHEAAVGNRDALANYKAIQTRDNATSKENAAYTLQEQQLQAHLNDQLAQERTAETKSENQENTSYTKRYNQLVQALNDAQVAESRAAGLAAAYQAQANANAQVAAVVHQDALYNIAASGGALVEQAFAGTMSRLAQIAAQYSAPTAYGLNNTGGNLLTSGYGNTTSVIRQIATQQINMMIQEANR